MQIIVLFCLHFLGILSFSKFECTKIWTPDAAGISSGFCGNIIINLKQKHNRKSLESFKWRWKKKVPGHAFYCRNAWFAIFPIGRTMKFIDHFIGKSSIERFIIVPKKTFCNFRNSIARRILLSKVCQPKAALINNYI